MKLIGRIMVSLIVGLLMSAAPARGQDFSVNAYISGHAQTATTFDDVYVSDFVWDGTHYLDISVQNFSKNSLGYWRGTGLDFASYYPTGTCALTTRTATRAVYEGVSVVDGARRKWYLAVDQALNKGTVTIYTDAAGSAIKRTRTFSFASLYFYTGL